MKIKWLGHSCFLLTSGNGTKILTDPFDATVGYPLPSVEADIVTTSHDHYDHNYIDAAKGAYKHVSGEGKNNIHNIEITGVPSFHDNEAGAKRGKNIIYKFTVDGIHICHCGDLGHLLSEQQIKDIGHVDILLVPVGGKFTIDAAGAVQVIKQLKPSISIPMHYKTELLKFEVQGVEKFLSIAGKAGKINKQEIELSKNSFSEFPPVIVLDYK